MSNKLPLYAVDKCPVTVRIPVEVKVKLDMLADETGIPASSLAAVGVSDMLKDRPFGVRELARVNEIVQENIMTGLHLGIGGKNAAAQNQGGDGDAEDAAVRNVEKEVSHG